MSPLLSLSLLLAVPSIFAQDNLVHAPAGSVQGTLTNEARIFLGIPYARPPVGALRWQPPQPYPTWPGIRPATHYSTYDCTQNEDCLYLNVWTPRQARNFSNIPVALFVHGGCYTGGNGALDLDSVYSLPNINLVVVAMNYRLGAMGFLGGREVQSQTSDGSCGNFGIQDQRLAMQWVRTNIASFGGDPSRVFLFGESAGAGSVAVHLLAPKSFGLYQRAGMESGSFAVWNTNSMTHAQQVYDRFVSRTNCSNLACLKTMSFEAVTKAANVRSPCAGHTPWAAVVDGVELTAPAWKLAQQGRFAPGVPVLLGANGDEGTYFVPLLPTGANDAQYRTWLNNEFGVELATQVHNMYPGTVWPPAFGYSAPWYAGMQAAGDYSFVCPHARAATWLEAAGHQTFLYHFTHTAPLVSPFSFHGLELFYVSHKLNVLLLDADGWAMSNVMLPYWANFAANGNPNGIGQPQWPRYDAAHSYVELHNSTQILPKKALKESLCKLWDDYLERMGADCVPADPRSEALCGGDNKHVWSPEMLAKLAR
jgi:para-nitrobenzyl esterase